LDAREPQTGRPALRSAAPCATGAALVANRQRAIEVTRGNVAPTEE
jgi:hypothetical protein